jgi:hypothetical protein
MLIELMSEQHAAVASGQDSPPLVIDPATRTRYVLVREEVYNRVKSLLDVDDDEESLSHLHPHVMEVFGRDGWDDPAMDVYNDLDPRRER